MNDNKERRIRKIPTNENYPEVHKHLLMGKILEITDSYLRLHCRMHHFGRFATGCEDVEIGGSMIRVVRRNRIGIINETAPTFDCRRRPLTADTEAGVLFSDAVQRRPVGCGTRCEVRHQID